MQRIFCPKFHGCQEVEDSPCQCHFGALIFTATMLSVRSRLSSGPNELIQTFHEPSLLYEKATNEVLYEYMYKRTKYRVGYQDKVAF